MSKKSIRVKVKKRKLKIKRILICILMMIIFVLLLYYILKLPIKNIYIIDNNVLSDKEIIDISGIENYPSFLGTRRSDIIANLKTSIYIKDTQVKKKFLGKIYIYVTEKKILCIYNDKLILEDGMITNNTNKITSYPILLSDISNIQEKFVKKFSLIQDNILLKISEIEYVPNEVDNERFLLKMNDDNVVYITLNKIEKINKYNSIYSSLNDKKGIIYLDSGDYVEVKEE